MGKVRAKIKIQIECVATAILDENECNGELSTDEVIDIIDITDCGDFEVIDYL